MEPDTTPKKVIASAPTTKPVIHTYEADLALAMDATDATVVQELLETAREKETEQKEREVIHKERGWYTAGGVILLILALGAAAYGAYYYRTLTVTVTPAASVGVFPSTDAIIAGSNVREELVRVGTALPEDKPFLIPIVTDTTPRSLLDTTETLSYLGISMSEPFVAAIDLMRLGVIHTNGSVSPFLLFSVPNPENASKEFLIAEPRLLEMTAPLFAIDLSNQSIDIAPTFSSTSMYNLPVRTLKATNVDTREQTILLYYGYATDHTVVVATNPTILKAVYDTIIRQR